MTTRIDTSHNDARGNPIVTVPTFGARDRDDRPFVPTPMVSGMDAAARMDVQDRDKARKALVEHRVTLPDLDKAFEVYHALGSHVVDARVPTLPDDVTPDAAVEILDSYIGRKAAEAVAANAKAALIGQVAARVQREHYAGVDVILAGLQDAYSKAAGRFMKAYSALDGAETLEAAAALAKDGSGVASWHSVNEAASELHAIVDHPLWAIKPERVTGNRGEDVGRLVTVAYGITDAPLHLDRRIIRGMATEDAPFGIPGLILAHDGVLSLPESLDDWHARLDVFG